MRYNIVVDEKQEDVPVYRLKDMINGRTSDSYYMTLEAAERAMRQLNERNR